MSRDAFLFSLLLFGCAAPSDGGRDGKAGRDTDGADSDTDSHLATDSPDDSDTGAHDTDRPRVPARFEVGEAVVCADPTARSERPYDRWEPGGAWATQDVDVGALPLFAGGGVAVADVDDDGDLDVFRTSQRTGFAWYDLGTDPPTDRTGELGDLPPATAGVVLVDVEGDGDLDLHVTVFGGPDRLYRQRTGGFDEVAVSLGLAGPPEGRSLGAAWADADGDGDMDAFVGAYGPFGTSLGPEDDGEPSHLYLQQDDGTFVDAIADLPDEHALKIAYTYQGAFVELDGDTTPELYVVNDFGAFHTGRAYDLVAGAPVELGPLGLEAPISGMGLALGDLGRDGLEDVVVPAVDFVGVYVSRPGGWFEASRLLGVRVDAEGIQDLGWGAELADLDNDGDLDLFVPFGQLDESGGIFANAPRQPDALWIQTDGFFVDAASSWGLDHRGVGRGVVVVDLNRDGWLDLVQQDLTGPTRVQIARCGEAAWLGMRLHQDGRNPRGVGATVTVSSGESRWQRTIRAGGTSYASAGPPEVLFGLGALDQVDTIEVRWPDGSSDRVNDLPTRRWITISR